MGQVKYTVEHEWLRVEDDGLVTVGITDFAQGHLGDLVFVQLPEVDSEMAQGDEAAVIESVKAASEIMMPVAGKVVEINTTLADEPGKVNEDPLGAGWFFKMKVNDIAELNSLMDEAAYAAMIKGQA
ncbi:glycine cleavage system H protein [Collimonas sp. OK242]|jgi:glycine cleavage system H protein|uniref:glycine cleavage system protein GcvH n=1 Tax=Collimonas sp. OK242 TaxID=1798195 RepID=UPI00089CA05C|nr:glycine cleavage system protein GcvH [Collimonas sp. OK242]SDX27817.1 glycine cleavage system H protein [Collimonas sp. OK242]